MRHIGFDYETYLISESEPYPKPVCLSYYENEENNGVIVGFPQIHKWLKDHFSNSDVKLIAHSLEFELNVTRRWFPDLIPLIRQTLRAKRLLCTKVCERVLDCGRKYPNNRASLADLVKYYFKIDISASKTADSWRLRYSELDGIPVEKWDKEAYDYALMDSKYALSVYACQQKIGVDGHVSILADFYLNFIGSIGFKIDQATVEIIEKDLLNALIPAYKYLYEQGLANIQVKTGKFDKKTGAAKYKILKNKALEEEVINNVMKYTENYKIGMYSAKQDKYIEENFKEVVLTKKGKIAKDSEALPKYISEKPDDAVIKALMIVQENSNYYRSFIKPFKTVTDVFRSQYNSHISTGRTSSSKSKFYPSGNIQQVPKE